ncbi:MAG: penicillin-insensitive murein endopeptidase [Gallionellaceae bacterium]|jgi:penicillin-insensitive murein endopeptidase
MHRYLFAIAAIIVSMTANSATTESTCFGTVSNGHLENGVKLPGEGKNFTAYSSLGVSLGRTHVHSKVAEIVVAAYAALEKSASEKVFMYGETGWPDGGRIRPHKTHKNGLSVDFMVPVSDGTGQSVYLPAGVSNKFGYNIDFDADARFEGYTIDFEAISEHLYQLHVAAKAHGAGIALVILDPPYLPKLFATKRGQYLKDNIHFMQGKAWIRHDEHYHVDFSVPCKPNKG